MSNGCAALSKKAMGVQLASIKGSDVLLTVYLHPISLQQSLKNLPQFIDFSVPVM